MTPRETTTIPGTMTGAARAAKEHAGPPAPGWLRAVLHVAGAGLLIATGAIHLDLYLTGYRTIPTIGWLFLLQVIAAFGRGRAVLAIPGRLVTLCRRRPGHPQWLPAVGLDRVVRVPRGPRHRRHHGRPGGGGRLRGPDRQRTVPGPPRLGAAS